MTPALTAVPDGPTYDDLVRLGREAREHADQYQWSEGDLALKVETLTGSDRPRDDAGMFVAGENLLRRYADDVDVDHTTLKGWRNVCRAWPPDRRRSGVPYSVHAALAPVTDRFDHIRDGMTVREARELSKALRGIGTGGGSGRKPGWFELAGTVGDDLIAAEKHLRTFEAAIGRQPNKDLAAKLERYAAIARDVADRLDAVREWREAA